MSSSSYFKKKCKAFYEAAGQGDLPLVKSLSLDPEVDLNWQDDLGQTPFFHACRSGHVTIVRYLLYFHDNQREPVEYNLADNDGWTPFHIACDWSHEKVVEMLVDDERIDLNRPDGFEETPLYIASEIGQVNIVKTILASTRQIDTLKKEKYDGKTAAEIARENGAEIKQSWESEEEFQQRKKGCPLIVSMIESYQQDPDAVKERLRRELGIDERWAGELFALVVFLSDGYLKTP